MRRLLLLVSMCALPYVLFGDVSSYVDSSTGQFGEIDLATGAFTPIGTNTVGTGIAALGGTIYGEDTSEDLVTINPLTGATTEVGATGIDLLTFTAFDGSLFGTDSLENLYSINASTGAATLVGSTGLGALDPAYAISLAGGSTNLYYTVDDPSLGPSLYTLNTTTGAPTLVGSTAGDVAGSAFVGNTLYGFIFPYVNGSDTPQIDTIDTSTGAATFVADTSSSVNGSINGGIPSPVPEPSSVVFLARLSAYCY
jgi:hypothetical protein